MEKLRNMAAALAIAGGGTLAAGSASATTLVALSGDDKLTLIDVESARVVGTTRVQGSSRVTSIDVRPANGKLYGLFDNGTFAVINPTTGARSNIVELQLKPEIARHNIDFNPVVDRLRIVGANGDNLRADVDTGVITLDTPINGVSPFGDENVRIVAVAYTNSVPGAEATQLYDIDAEPEGLYLQNPPNSGTLSGVGRVGRNLQSFGFDIGLTADGRNRARIVAGNRLVEIDLGGGAVVSSEQIQGLGSTEVRDLTTLNQPN